MAACSPQRELSSTHLFADNRVQSFSLVGAATVGHNYQREKTRYNDALIAYVTVYSFGSYAPLMHWCNYNAPSLVWVRASQLSLARFHNVEHSSRLESDVMATRAEALFRIRPDDSRHSACCAFISSTRTFLKTSIIPWIVFSG